MSELIILGGGLAGISLAALYRGRSIVLEKEETPGGLCRSFELNGIAYDVGPHIIFSKNTEVLERHVDMVDCSKIRRENAIFYKGHWVKYPFENELSALPEADRDLCLATFINNPYEQYHPQNMLQFFLHVFGEGMTKCYFEPYNSKIWKCHPCCLDLQMVSRIPKPPPEDIIKSAHGTPTEGYTHQLYFYYPRQGGVQSLYDAWRKEAGDRADLRCGVRIQRVERHHGQYRVKTDLGDFTAPRIVNCMPLHELVNVLPLPPEIEQTIRSRLLYNSIHIVIVQARKDLLGNRFAVYLPDDDILMHRLSRLNFLGEAYCLPDGGVSLMAEITFRPGTPLAAMTSADVKSRVVADLCRLGFVESPEDVIDVELRTFPYAYVIYDLNHRSNTDQVLNYLRAQGIDSLGRFAEFEYVNTDQVVERAMKLAAQLNEAPLAESDR